MFADERSTVSGFHVDACDFGQMKWSVLAATVLEFLATRAWPSGKAKASQAFISRVRVPSPAPENFCEVSTSEASSFWWICLVDFGAIFQVLWSTTQIQKSQVKSQVALPRYIPKKIGKLVPYHLATPACAAFVRRNVMIPLFPSTIMQTGRIAKIIPCAAHDRAVLSTTLVLRATRGCGGIGRRVRFRSVWGSPHGGSSPLTRTRN